MKEVNSALGVFRSRSNAAGWRALHGWVCFLGLLVKQTPAISLLGLTSSAFPTSYDLSTFKKRVSRRLWTIPLRGRSTLRGLLYFSNLYLALNLPLFCKKNVSEQLILVPSLRDSLFFLNRQTI